MQIVHSTGIEGARRARGTVVVIDVLRSFTVSAFALAGGARECRLVATTAQARALAASIPGALLCAEEDALPIEGIAISNSPTQIRAADLKDRVLVQRSSAGTPVVAAVDSDDIYAASLAVARATVQSCLLTGPATLTLIASADYPGRPRVRDLHGEHRARQEADLDSLLQALARQRPIPPRDERDVARASPPPTSSLPSRLTASTSPCRSLASRDTTG